MKKIDYGVISEKIKYQKIDYNKKESNKQLLF
jgi:hypothetical protein